jgi:hypothetical protein
MQESPPMPTKDQYFVPILFRTFCADEKGIPVSFLHACDLQNNDQIIEVSGYISDGGSVYCSNRSGRNEYCIQLLDSPKHKSSVSQV